MFNFNFPMKISLISSGEKPLDKNAPAMAPELVPEISEGEIPLSCNAFTTPKWAKPRQPPPDKTKYFFFNLVTNLLHLNKGFSF